MDKLIILRGKSKVNDLDQKETILSQKWTILSLLENWTILSQIDESKTVIEIDFFVETFQFFLMKASGFPQKNYLETLLLKFDECTDWTAHWLS